jgi:hypothetical protein
MENVVWTKERNALATDEEVTSFRKVDVFNLYDALLCLTDSRYRDEHLRIALALPSASG